MQLNEEDFKRLDAYASIDNVKMKETDFVKRLLPHLIPNESGQLQDMSIWVAATGHAYRMIDVIDDSTGKTLYTVPPLFAPTPMTIRDNDSPPETDIGEISAVFHAEMLSGHPGAVIDKFVETLTKMTYTPARAIETVYSIMWAKIYERYNIPLERLFGERADEIRKLAGTAEQKEVQPGVATGLKEFGDDDFEDF